MLTCISTVSGLYEMQTGSVGAFRGLEMSVFANFRAGLLIAIGPHYRSPLKVPH